MVLTTFELLWLVQLLRDLFTVPTKLLCDNNSVIHIVSNLVFHERTNHVEIDYYTMRNQLKHGFLKLFHVSFSNQHVDILTMT